MHRINALLAVVGKMAGMTPGDLFNIHGSGMSPQESLFPQPRPPSPRNKAQQCSSDPDTTTLHLSLNQTCPLMSCPTQQVSAGTSQLSRMNCAPAAICLNESSSKRSRFWQTVSIYIQASQLPKDTRLE